MTMEDSEVSSEVAIPTLAEVLAAVQRLEQRLTVVESRLNDPASTAAAGRADILRKLEQLQSDLLEATMSSGSSLNRASPSMKHLAGKSFKRPPPASAHNNDAGVSPGLRGLPPSGAGANAGATKRTGQSVTKSMARSQPMALRSQDSMLGMIPSQAVEVEGFDDVMQATSVYPAGNKSATNPFNLMSFLGDSATTGAYPQRRHSASLAVDPLEDSTKRRQTFTSFNVTGGSGSAERRRPATQDVSTSRDDMAPPPKLTKRKSIGNVVREAFQPPQSGLTERHPVMAALDVSFVVCSYISVMVAIGELYPTSPFSDTSAYFYYVVGWHAFSSVQAIVWMISRFYLSKRRDWHVIDDLPGIRRHYLRTWFAFDFFMSLPYDFIFAQWNWPIYTWLQIRHFLRLPRIFFLGRSANPLLGARLWFRFVSFCFFLILIVVALGAVFYSLEPEYTYDQAVYWAVATITSVGYGDVVPTNSDSRVFVIFAMFFGVMMLSTTTAFATSFLTSKERLTEEEDAKKQMMYSMLEHYNVPWEVQREVIGAMPALIAQSNEDTFKEMTSKLPPFIASKLNGYVRGRMLRHISMLQGLEISSLVRLSECLTQEFFPPGSVLVEEGTLCTKIFFLLRGVAQVSMTRLVPKEKKHEESPLDEDNEEVDLVVERIITLHDGDHFGDLEAEGELARATVEAVTLCETLTLARSDYEALLHDPQIGQSLRDAVTQMSAPTGAQAVLEEP